MDLLVCMLVSEGREEHVNRDSFPTDVLAAELLYDAQNYPYYT